MSAVMALFPCDASWVLPYRLTGFLHFSPFQNNYLWFIHDFFLTSSHCFLVVLFANQVNRPIPSRKHCGLPDEAVLPEDVSNMSPPCLLEKPGIWFCSWQQSIDSVYLTQLSLSVNWISLLLWVHVCKEKNLNYSHSISILITCYVCHDWLH